jgi:bifunctional enzyme CysN/CysC
MKGKTLLLTGLSGSGKSTIAEAYVNTVKNKTVLIDGDIMRQGLSKYLGFSKGDRIENNRRLIEVCKILNDNGIDVITAFIMPYNEARLKAKDRLDNCYIVYIDCPIDECIKRDPKGLYKKAINKEIPNFTGITDPYEEPEYHCDLRLDTVNLSVIQCVEKIIQMFEPDYHI